MLFPMFTGIVQAVGTIQAVTPLRKGVRLRVDAGGLSLAGVSAGDSLCVQGACLTLVKRAGRKLEFEVSPETLDCTAGLDRPGKVNLERSLALGDELGGHLVTGHVDGVGRTVAVNGSVYVFRAPRALARYIARKGSICLDGVSLTVNRVRGADFEVNLIPHTLKATTLKRLARGSKVNLEVDLLARYVARLSEARG
jgi:riboflavin synthase